MAHNGGRSQIGLNFINGGDFPFINRMKESVGWVGTQSGKQLLAEDRDANGYPTRFDNMRDGSNNIIDGVAESGVKNQYINCETAAEYDGLWVHQWTGKGRVGLVQAGSFGSGFSSANQTNATETTGYYEVYGPSTGLLEPQIRTIPTIGQHSRDMLVCRKDQYAIYTEQKAANPNLEPFNPIFLAALADLNPGYLRFLDWGRFNTNQCALFDHRVRVGHFSYQAADFRAQYLATGLTGNTGDAFTALFPGFGPLTHGSAVIVRWGAVPSDDTFTLDVEGTGAKSVRNAYGRLPFPAEIPVQYLYSLLVFDALLDVWLKVGNSLSVGLSPMVPLEVCFDLCNRVGAHAWFPQPMMALDAQTSAGTNKTTATDWVEEVCALADEMLDPGLKLVMQGINESFNTAQGFNGGAYGSNKALAQWPSGGSFNIYNWTGKTVAIMGKTIHDYFADKGGTDRYEVLVEVQTVGGSLPGVPVGASADPSQTAPDFVNNNGGWPAHQYSTGVCWANYWGAQKTTNEIIASGYDLEFQTASAERQLEILDWYVGATDPVAWVETMAACAQNWSDWANKFVTGKTLCYEGGPSFDLLTSTPTLVINGASKAVQCVLSVTTADMTGLIGRTVTPSSVGGMTQLNGNSYTVVAVSGTNITINVDSTGFTTYTSGGSLAMDSTMFTVNAVRANAYRAPRCFDIMQQVHQRMSAVPNVIAPSQFLLIGGKVTVTPPSTVSAQPWGIGHGNIQNPDWSPGYDAIKLFNNRKIRLRLGAP